MSDEQEAAATTEPPKEETEEAPAGEDAAPKEEESTATFEPVVRISHGIAFRSQTFLLLGAPTRPCSSRIYVVLVLKKRPKKHTHRFVSRLALLFCSGSHSFVAFTLTD